MSSRTKYNRDFYRRQSPEWKRRKIKRTTNARLRWLQSLKNRPCDRCHVAYPTFVLDWHHRNPQEKLFGLGRGGWFYGKQKILDEITKCDLLCANCHRFVEYAEQSVVGEVVNALVCKTSIVGSIPTR